MKEKPELGKRIQEARKAAGLNQTELAEKLEKTLRTVQKYESGEIAPSIATINQMAKIFNVSPAELMGYEKQNIRIDTVADVIYIINELNNKADLHFDIIVEKPTDDNDNQWTCSLKFDGNHKTADYNADLCLFLESYKEELEEKGDTPSGQAYFDKWFERQLAFHSSSKFLF